MTPSADMRTAMGTQAQPLAGAHSGALSNNQIRDLVTRQAVTMRQQIYSATVYPPSNPTVSLNTAVRNVGIIKRFVVEIVATLNNTGASNAVLTDFGLSNLIANVQLYDFNNNLRINTDGKHLVLVSTAKRRQPFGACANWYAINPGPGANLGFASGMFNVPQASWGVFQATPSTIPAGQSATVRAVFEIPCAYSDHDLRGGIYAGIVNSQMNPVITLNVNAFAFGPDSTNAVYAGSSGVFTSASMTVTQEYLDQIPSSGGRLLLPQTDLSTVYELKETTFQNVTAGRDFPLPFSNFRSFMSLVAIYNNNPNAGTGREFGNDINYWSRQTANFTNIFQYDPLYNALLTREIIGSELPAGCYLFSFRQQPIITTQFGNQQVNLNANVAATGNYILAYWEDMALQNTLQGSASLPG